jgi:hypothetical protein
MRRLLHRIGTQRLVELGNRRIERGNVVNFGAGCPVHGNHLLIGVNLPFDPGNLNDVNRLADFSEGQEARRLRCGFAS